MADQRLDHEGARTIRSHWFKYLDTIEPLRAALHAYCHKLTGNIWDAEDLLQDTLLKGFGMVARGDFHGPNSPVRDARSYLFRTATNAWLDVQRGRRRAGAFEALDPAWNDSDPAETGDALAKAAALASPQEFAAIVLKEAYDFTLEEIAEFIGTTPGTVKSALSRARRKMNEHEHAWPGDPQKQALVRAFVDAINSRDVDRVIALMADEVQIRVCNVGGGRGRSGIWTQKSLGAVHASFSEVDGEAVVLMFRDGEEALWDVLRLDGTADTVTRIVDHCYAPETLQRVSEHLGLECLASAYHQPWHIIERDMVPTTFLPWRASAERSPHDS